MTTAELDRLRWALTEAAMSNVRLALTDLTRDRDRYLAVLAGYVAVAAASLPPGDLVAEVRPEDEKRLAPRWAAMSTRVARGRAVALGTLAHPSEDDSVVADDVAGVVGRHRTAASTSRRTIGPALEPP